MQNKDYALVVGIDDYVETRPLQGAVKDAEEFVSWLKHGQGGHLPDENCHVVLSEEVADGQDPIPMQPRVDRALGEIIRQAETSSPRRLYVFFAGHGISDQATDVDLCMANWSDVFRNAALSSAEYVDTLKTWGLFEEVVFFLDCCRNEEISASGLGPTLRGIGPGPTSTKEFRAYATQFLSRSFEGPDGSTDSEARGYFSRALMAGLWGGAARDMGGVPASRLQQYLAVETPRIANENGYFQKPEIINGLRVLGEPIFGSAKPIDRVQITFTDTRAGHRIVLEDASLNELQSGNVATAETWTHELKRGNHMLRDETNNESVVIRFRPDMDTRPIKF